MRETVCGETATEVLILAGPEGPMEGRQFNAVEVQVLLSVFRQACADVGPVDEKTKAKIADRILRMAREGEKDFEVLRRHATKGMTTGSKGN